VRSLFLYHTIKLIFFALGFGTREGGQEEIGERGLLSDARGGKIKRGKMGKCEGGRGILKSSDSNKYFK